jgi:hypothetical protein
MIFQSVIPDEYVFMDTGHNEFQEIEISGRFLRFEETQEGMELVSLISTNPYDYLNNRILTGNGLY